MAKFVSQALYVEEDTLPPVPVQLVCTNLPGSDNNSYVCAPK